MIQLYYFALSTPSLACLMVAEAAGAEYEKHYVDLRNGEQRSAEYIALNPMGKVPAMVDGDLVLSESTAIQRYIARTTRSGLYPEDLIEQARLDLWLNLIAHEVRTPILDIEVYRWAAELAGNPANEGVVSVCNYRLDRALPVLEKRLETSPYLNGDALSIADISLVSSLDPADTIGFDLAPYPHLRKRLDAGREASWYKAVNPHFAAELGL